MASKIRRAAIFAVLVSGMAFAQGGTTSADILPANSGQKLGNANQRWTVNALDIDIKGNLTCKGVPCVVANADPNAVKLTGDETIGGKKTFTDETTFAKVKAASSNGIAGEFNMSVTDAGVFGHTPISGWCNITNPGGVCYAGSFTTVDATDGSGYTHTVGPQITVQQMHTPGSGRDVYGLPVGLTLAAGVHPGAGVRVERQVGTTGELQSGQIAVAFDADTATTPVALFARGQCATGSCESSAVKFTGMNNGAATLAASLSVDSAGMFRFRPAGIPGAFVFDAITSATVSNNYSSPILYLSANAWSGSASVTHNWTIQHSVNASGALASDTLSILPPSTTGAVTPSIHLGAGLSANAAGFKHVRLTGSNVDCNAQPLGGLCSNTAYTWPTPFADNNYTLTCSVVSASDGLVTIMLTGKTASGFQVVSIGAINSSTNKASEVDCIAVHD